MTCFLRMPKNDPPGMLHTGGMCPGSMCVAVYWQMCAVPGIGALCLAQPPAVCMKAFPSHVAECARHAKVAPILFMAHALDVGRNTPCRGSAQHTGIPVRGISRAWGRSCARCTGLPGTGVPGHCGRVPLSGGSHTTPPVSLAGCCVPCADGIPRARRTGHAKGGKRGVARYSARVSAGLSCGLCRFGVIPLRKRLKQCRRRICAYP